MRPLASEAPSPEMIARRRAVQAALAGKPAEFVVPSGAGKREWRRSRPKPLDPIAEIGLRIERLEGAVAAMGDRVVQSVFVAAAALAAVIVLAASAAIIVSYHL